MASNEGKGFEELTDFDLQPDVEAQLLDAQTECTFIWSNREGWPVGLTMSFLFDRGSFWLTTSGQHHRVAAVRRDPRVAIVVSSLGSSMPPMKTLTYKGTCTVHDDEELKAWFFPKFAASLRRGDEEWQRGFVEELDTPRRVLLEVVPGQRIAFDGDKLYQGSRRWAALGPEAD